MVSTSTPSQPKRVILNKRRLKPSSSLNNHKKFTNHMLTSPKFYSRKDLMNVNLHRNVLDLLEYIREKESFLKSFSKNFCRNSSVDCQIFQNSEYHPFIESNFIYEFNPPKIEELRGLRVAAVDGGLGFQEYLGLRLTMVKVAVVQYEFQSGFSPVIRNFPPLRHDENYAFYSDFGGPLNDSTSTLAGLRRTLAENSMLLQFLKSEPNTPDLVILDGSITPPLEPYLYQGDDKISSNFTAVLQSYYELYSFCESHRILLVGSIKDTRSTNLRDLIIRAFPKYLSSYKSMHKLQKISYRKYLQRFSDIDLLFEILKPKERSIIFRCDKWDQYRINNSELKYLKKIPIYASYIQISSFDVPLRLEFLGMNENRDQASISGKMYKILEILFPLSQIHPQCSLPLPQIEVHLRAHLREEELELIARQLETKFKVAHLKDISQKEYDDVRNRSKSETEEIMRKSAYSTFLKKRHERMDNIF
ncbi:MAG: DNA double-strand break repair nuclease NurA [Promethearchaeota archaeon]